MMVIFLKNVIIGIITTLIIVLFASLFSAIVSIFNIKFTKLLKQNKNLDKTVSIMTDLLSIILVIICMFCLGCEISKWCGI